MIITQNIFDLLKPMPPFIEPMRRANRGNYKSQTRRVMDSQPAFVDHGSGENSDWVVEWCHPRSGCLIGEWGEGESVPIEVIACSPYGKPGQIRYMREPLYRGGDGYARYMDDNLTAFSLLNGKPIEWKWRKDVLAQLYMPKIAARTFKQYEFIHVERLQDIGKDENVNDLFEEGLYKYAYSEHDADGELSDFDTDAALDDYIELWNSINAKRGFAWESNPWVWVIGYGPLEIKELSPKNIIGPVLGKSATLLIVDDFVGGTELS